MPPFRTPNSDRVVNDGWLFALVLLTVCGLSIPAIADSTHKSPVSILTSGPGDDSEAAWSPDGRLIAFQSDRDGTLDLLLYDVKTGHVKPLVHGPGHACFPAWSPDGKWIVYSYAHFTKTAFEGIKNGYNLFVVPCQGGTPRRLTEGLHRDYCPAFSADGKTIYYSSNRGVKRRENQVNLCAIPFEGGESKVIRVNKGRGVASVQPTLSTDSLMVAFGQVSGFRGNWAIHLARLNRPDYGIALSGHNEVFYGPRWSPKGNLLACTGYRDGDDGWCVYLIDAKTGCKQRVPTGPGNSRSPAWSQDGRELVFENNRSGSYKLYRVRVPEFTTKPAQTLASVESVPAGAVMHYCFEKKSGKVIKDLSPLGNDGGVHGAVVWKNGAVSFTGEDIYIAVPRPKGFDFGTGPFSVQATVNLPEYGDKCYICVGADPRHRLGWQLMVDKSGYVRFNSRTPDGTYCGAISNTRIPKGCMVELIAMRDEAGRVSLYVDGILQQRCGDGALFSYQQPDEVRIGRQISGAGGFFGSIYSVTVYRRLICPVEAHAVLLQRFWSRK
ncbi:MAG: PD40 domain-containing protein [Pirellulales bacterium]|nr:PD40 domain-containing protein [Pirellulales bacterium]